MCFTNPTNAPVIFTKIIRRRHVEYVLTVHDDDDVNRTVFAYLQSIAQKTNSRFQGYNLYLYRYAVKHSKVTEIYIFFIFIIITGSRHCGPPKTKVNEPLSLLPVQTRATTINILSLLFRLPFSYEIPKTKYNVFVYPTGCQYKIMF